MALLAAVPRERLAVGGEGDRLGVELLPREGALRHFEERGAALQPRHPRRQRLARKPRRRTGHVRHRAGGRRQPASGRRAAPWRRGEHRGVLRLELGEQLLRRRELGAHGRLLALRRCLILLGGAGALDGGAQRLLVAGGAGRLQRGRGLRALLQRGVAPLRRTRGLGRQPDLLGLRQELRQLGEAAALGRGRR